MSISRVVQSAVCAGVFLLVGVVPAVAAWPFSEPAPIVCGYGTTYFDAGGATITHTGVDIAADEGSSVLAVQAGRVTFAGRVPAAGGGSVLAVTVETAGGERWTYLPLATVGVSSGQTVECGALLGPLAPSGDRSSPASHLHLSLRRGESYIDPMPFISYVGEAPDTSAVSGEVQVPVVPAESVRPAVDGGPLHAAAPALAPITVPVCSPVPSVSGVSVQSQSLQPLIRASDEAPARSAPACAREAELSRSRLMRTNTSAPARSGVDEPVDTPSSTARAGGPALRSSVPYPVLGLGLGLLFLPAAWLAINRSLSSRVTAPGDTVAAAVGR